MLSLITGAMVALGLFLLYRERRHWWEHWLKDRALGWLAMLSVVAVAGLIIPTQRPRPSYLFCQGIFLMAVTGMSFFAISHRWPVLRNLSRCLPIVMFVLLVGAPNRYHSYSGPRPLLALYERLAPLAAIFNRPDSVFLVSAYPMEIHAYVGHNYFTNPFANLDYTILDQAPVDRPLPSFLDRQGVNLFYVDETLWRRLDANPVYQPFLRSPESAGWGILIYQNGPNGRWMLLRKSPSRSSS